MPQVSIPAALRPQVDGQSEIAVEGATVGAILVQLKVQYPAFGARLYKADGELNRFINVYVNNEDIRFTDGLETPVSAKDEIAIIPAIAGG